MALFGKSDPREGALRKLKQSLYRGRDELLQLISQLEGHGVSPKDLSWMLMHRETEVRELAMRSVASGAVGGDVFKALLGELSRQPGSSRRQIVKMLIDTEPAEALKRIGPLAVSRRQGDREIALELLEQHPDWLSQMQVIKGLLADPIEELRVQAAGVLAREPAHPGVFLQLIDLMRSEDKGVRRCALRALAETGNADIVEPFLDRLPQETGAEQAIIVRALGKFAQDPRSKIEEKVLPALADERDAVRNAAVQLLGQMPDRARAIRSFLLEAPHLAYWLRERCVKSLLRIKDQLVEPLLTLMTDESMDVRVGALTLAADIGDERFVQPLSRVVASSEDWWIRALAADVLAAHPTPEVVQCLVGQLEDPDMRYSIVSALGKTGCTEALPHIIQALQAPVRGIRSCAVDALAKYPEGPVIEWVAHLALNDPEGSVRDKAEALLRSFGTVAQAALRQVEEAAHARVQAHDASVVTDCGGLQMENDLLNESAGPMRIGMADVAAAPRRESD